MAAADALRVIRNAPYRLIVPLTDQNGTLLSGEAGSADSEYSSDSGAFGDCTNEVTEIGSSGVYTLDLTAAEMTASASVTIKITGSASVKHIVKNLELEPALESGVAQASTSTSLTLRSAASATDDLFNGAMVEIVRGTGQGQVRTIVDYVGSTKIITVDRAWQTNPSSSSVYRIVPGVGVKLRTSMATVADMDEIDNDTAAATALQALYQGGLVQATIDDSTPTTSEFDGVSTLSSSDDYYNGQLLIMTSGTMAGQMQKISDYTGSSRTITLTSAFPSAPGNGDEFVILGRSF